MERALNERDARRDDAAAVERELWRRHAHERSVDARAALIEMHLPLARRIAAALYAKRFDDTIEFNDYLQSARIGLVEAVDRFDAQRAVAFSTFATYRIRGAVLNALEQGTERAAQRLARTVPVERVASLHDEYDDGFAGVVAVAVDLALGYLLSDSEADQVADTRASGDPYGQCELRSLQRRMAVLLEALPERERFIVRRHYLEDHEFQAIADELGLTKGRVSQLHARAMRLLREAHAQSRGLDLRC